MLSITQKLKRTFHTIKLIGQLAWAIYWPCALVLLLTNANPPLPTVPPAVVALASHAVLWGKHMMH